MDPLALTFGLLSACLQALAPLAGWANFVFRRSLLVIIPGIFCAYLALQALSHVFGTLKTVHASACELPVLSSWGLCSQLVSDPLTLGVHHLPTVISDPITACNILGGTLAPGGNITDYIPTMSFTGNLATNVSLWSSPSSLVENTSDSIRGTIPVLNDVARDLNDLVGLSHCVYQLAQSAFIHWTRVVHRESSSREFSAIYRAVPRLPEDLVKDLEGSLSLLDRSIRDTQLSLAGHIERVTNLHLAFADTSHIARREEWRLSTNAKRSWLPRTAKDTGQEELRRQVRLQSSYAACALEYALGSLRRISAALLALKELPKHVELDSMTDVTIALQTLQLRAEALNEATASLQSMLL
ncbi:hypothetical protein AURDEDRAFT_140604 [Auricularia subglabra TFB-10046 SS5]|uniref:Uncharacterized protein n=1 Tax=Auricularia subglabra (strain TFB-10046 / SS5) TaxID=717982 RepID=J0LC47_AURST|nr:hypothetical protein AURDEDRAFT_140604 [Auricularia subglabra TFB-10046 SS5]